MIVVLDPSCIPTKRFLVQPRQGTATSGYALPAYTLVVTHFCAQFGVLARRTVLLQLSSS